VESGARQLRIGIDAHAIGQRKTGNERFISHVARELQAICNHHLVLYLTEAASADEWRGTETEVRLLRPRHPLLRTPFALPLAARRDRLDILLVQGTGPPVLHCPLVSVVHDMAFAAHPEHFRLSQRAWMRVTIPWTMGRADRVVTVSRFSSEEIQNRYGIGEDKIVVAYDGVDPMFADQAPVPSPVEPPFFLAVGNLEPRKNLETLVRAFDLLQRRNSAIREKLVIVGQDRYKGNDIRALSNRLQRSGLIVFTDYIDDAKLVALVQAATAVAYPSVYEGFGLPVVEAMAAGIPAVVSDIPVMREVAADAALRVAALDVPAWATALERIAFDADLRSQLIDAGRRRANEFSWRRCAMTILATLETAADRSAPAISID
jgi:glycosyltransferase involved in cell wall biosynthesis